MNLFTVHTKNGLYIYRCSPVKPEEKDAKPGSPPDEDKADLVDNFTAECVWSQDRFARHCVSSHNNHLSVVDDRSGLSIVHMNSHGVSDLSIDTLRGVGKFKNMYTPLGCKNIKHLQWSNNGTYLVVYFNLTNYSDSGLCLEDNLHIWDISKKNIVATFSTRRLSPEQWPVIKWLGNTDNFAFCHNHQVSLHSIVAERSSLKSVRCVLTVPIPMVFSVDVFFKPQNEDGSFTQGDTVYMASFSQADSNRTPGSLRISTLTWDNEALLESAFEQHDLKFADSAELLWSPSGKYLMVLAQSIVDMAGEKYGSTTNCLLFAATGQFLHKVNTTTTHDARWNPKKDEFILLQGNMPCRITLHSAELETLFEFPSMYRNTIRWNPMGNMVALGGFGNLAGEICFWYKRPDSDEMEQIVQFKEPCTVLSEWSLDSRYFMTASTFPRMKVDNFFKIFNCEGYLISSETLDECYDVSWFCGNADSRDFVRPRVRKSLVRKAVYRPKLPVKTQKPAPVNTNFPRAPGSPIFSSVRSLSELSSTFSPPKPKSVDQNHARDNMNRSLFSDQFGNKCDPSVDLFNTFKHVFSMSFVRNANANQEPPRHLNGRPDLNQRMPEQFPQGNQRPPYVDNRQNFPDLRHNFAENARHSFPENARQNFQDNSRHTGPDNARQSFTEYPRLQFQENARQSHGEGQRQSFPEHSRPPFSENTRQSSQEQNRQSAQNSRKPSIEDSKNNSMFIRLKNQLQADRNKNSSQSIMDEGQLLRLLLEAKNRAKPD